MPIYTNDPYDDGLFPVEPSLLSSIGIGPKVTKAIDAATKDWLDNHPEATTTVEDDSITNVKLKDGSVNSRVIENESITTDDIADLAVTTPKIADDAVDADKIASSAADGLRIMSTTQPGVAKVGAGLAMNDGTLELNGGDIAPAVTAWLNAHPEATTTVQDGSINYPKLASDLKTVLVKKNLLPVNGNGTVAVLGLSVTYNDGVLAATGTTTGAGGRLSRLVEPFTLAAGTYTLSRSLDEATNISIMIEDAATNTVLGNAYNYYPATFTLSEDTSVYIGVSVANGRTYNAEVEVQLEKGSSVTPFVTPSTLNAADLVARAAAAAAEALANEHYANSLHKMDANDGLADADNAEINRIYLLIDVSSVTNLPIDQSGTLITLARHQMATVQLYCDVCRNLYYRGNWGNLGWSDWKKLVSLQEVSEMIPEGFEPSIMSAFTNITCCGDSLTWGQVYTGQSTSRQAYVTYPSALGKMTGATVTQHAVPGYTAVQWWNAFSSQITEKSNQLAIVFLGTNAGLTDTLDTDAPEGSEPATWNTSTNTGAYASIVNAFKSVGAKVLLLRCYVTSGTSESGSDLNTTNSVIDQIASRFGCGVVDAPNLTDDKYHYWPNRNNKNQVHYNDLGYSAFASRLIYNVASLDSSVASMLIPE